MSIPEPIAWGRTLAEYRAMFALSAPGAACRILDVAAGPASFAAEWCVTGGRAVACDPLYALGTEAIRARLATAESAVRELLAREAGRFVWRTFADTEELVAARPAAAERFLADLERRRDEGRYLPHALPALPFPDGSFDLALCSHFLFLYSAALNSAFHHTALGELLRVAREVRVFPLLTMDGAASPHLASVTAWLRRAGHGVTIRRVDYEVMRGGDRMLLMRRGA